MGSVKSPEHKGGANIVNNATIFDPNGVIKPLTYKLPQNPIRTVDFFDYINDI